MTRTLILSLHNAIEVSALLALLSAYLLSSGQQGLVSRLKWGAITGLVLSVALTWGVVTIWDRETVELVVNGLAAALTLAVIICLVWTNRTAYRRAVEKAHNVMPPVIFLAGVFFVTLPGFDLILTQTRIFMGLDRPTSTELTGKLSVVLLVLMVAVLAGTVLHKIAARARPGLVTTVTLIILFVVLIRDATTVTQVMLVKGMIPLTDWLFRVIVLLVNNIAIFFYLLVTAVVALVSVALWEWRRRKNNFDDLNPAQKRKLKVTAQRTARLFGTFGLLLFLVILGESTSIVLANHPPQLSPATPVAAERDQIKISMKSVADGQLHRFSFTTGDKLTVRFLVIHKGSGIYGVGLDACTFCGAAGYRQEKENVICNKCNAAINGDTIGFPGGCNPIPLRYTKTSEFVAITVEELESSKWLFTR